MNYRGSDQEHLCVLHLDRIVVYNVMVSSGHIGHGIQGKLTIAYQHHLQRHSHSLYVGKLIVILKC